MLQTKQRLPVRLSWCAGLWPKRRQCRLSKASLELQPSTSPAVNCPFAVSLRAGLASTSGLLLRVPLFFCISSCLDRQSNGQVCQTWQPSPTSAIHCAWLCTKIAQCGRLSFDTLPTWLAVCRGGPRGSGSGADAASDDPDLPDGKCDTGLVMHCAQISYVAVGRDFLPPLSCNTC